MSLSGFAVHSRYFFFFVLKKIYENPSERTTTAPDRHLERFVVENIKHAVGSDGFTEAQVHSLSRESVQFLNLFRFIGYVVDFPSVAFAQPLNPRNEFDDLACCISHTIASRATRDWTFHRWAPRTFVPPPRQVRNEQPVFRLICFETAGESKNRGVIEKKGTTNRHCHRRRAVCYPDRLPHHHHRPWLS